MTLVLKTKSHGGVEAGFYSIFTKLARIGKYAFETKNLCELAQYLANNPQTKELQISGWSADKFWEMENRHIESFMGLLENTKNTSKYVASEVTDIFFKENREMSLEDKASLMNEMITIPIKVNDNGDSLRIGEYEIEDIHFGRMMHYLTQGGWFGWSEDEPSFARPTLSAIKKSKNPLYKEIQRDFS